MTIKYVFANGEEVYVEVYGRIEKIVSKINREYKSKYKKNLEREHVSLNERMMDNNSNPENQIFKKIDKEILHIAISKLKYEDQEMLNSLFLNDQPVTQKEYAEKLGITSSMMQKRVERLKSKLALLVGADEQNCTK